MEKLSTVILTLMVTLTVIYVGVVAYTNSISVGESDEDGNHPMDYGIWKAYFAEKLETEPREWKTTEELGIIFGRRMKASQKETYEILIANPEKALPWMKGKISEPDATKYQDNFYDILFLWVTPGIPEPSIPWEIPLGVALAACWIFAVIFLKRRKKE